MKPYPNHSNPTWLIALIILNIFFISSLAAQTIHELPPNQPEQDACNALTLCGSSFFTPYSYTGAGRKSDLTSTPCLQGGNGGEINAVWLKLKIDQDGIVVFKIVPVNPHDDYDFAVLKIVDAGCSSLSPGDVVRCNFNNNYEGSNIGGVVGLSTTSSIPYVENGSFGNSYCQAIDAKAGDTYLVMINNFGNYVTSNTPSEGFKVDFTGSTATFNQGTPATLSGIDVPCNNATSITVNLSTEVLCSSIAGDGSDFSVDAPVAITSAAGVNCSSNAGYTNKVTLTFSSALPAANYILRAKTGSDNNTLLNLCDVALALPSADIPFTIAPGIKTIVNETICYSQLPYIWNGITVTKGGNGVAEYTTSSAGICDSTTVLNLTVSSPADSIRSSVAICTGQSYNLPWDSTVTTAGTYIHTYTNIAGCDSLIREVTVKIRLSPQVKTTGFCKDSSTMLSARAGFTTYLWSTGDTQESIVVKEQGVYTVEVKDERGCATTDTFNVQPYPVPAVAFNRQMALCDTISIIADAGSGFKSFLWNDGSTTQTLSISSAGTYWVTITDQHSCKATDSVMVSSYPSPSNFLVHEITKCSYDDAVVIPTRSFLHYNWSTGSMGKQIQVQDPGIYWLDATDVRGCTGRDSVVVADSACKTYVYIPTGFTPNADGKNDIFKPIVAGRLTRYLFTIYDRLGKQIFTTRDVALGWNGTINRLQQPAGTYIWVCEYKLAGQQGHLRRGSITLIR